MSGGGSKSQVTKVEPWVGQQPYIREALSQAQRVFGTPEQYYPGQAVAPFTQAQLAGQKYLTDYARGVQPLIGGAQRGAGFLASGQVLDVARNPYVRGMGQAMTGQVRRQLMSDILPEIETRYRRGGAFGGSKEGLAVGRAVEGATQQMTDALSQMYGQAYGQGLGAMQAGLQAMPAMTQLGAYPGQLLTGVGADQRAYEQALIDEARRKHQFYQEQPFREVSRYAGLAAGTGTGKTTTAPGQQTSPLATVAGLGLTGAGLFLGGPAGGLLGGLGSKLF